MRALALAFLFAFASLSGAQAQSSGYAFTILRGDSPIGTHTVSFARAGDTLTVDLKTEVVVKIAFITAYRYTQTARQVWKNGRLETYDCTTDDDGTVRRVQARATQAGLEVEGPQGRSTAPRDVMPTGYWNADLIKRGEALDSSGKIVKYAFAPLAKRAVQVDGRAIDAQFYKMTGGADGEIAYAADGTWVSLVLNERGGNVITYRRIPSDARK